MTFKLPRQFCFFDLIAMAKRGDFDPEAFTGQIELDFTDLEFAGSDAMACLKALLMQTQHDLDPDICFPVRHNNQDAVRYLKRMDFFSDDIRWCFPEGDDFLRHDSEGRFVPIKRINSTSECNSVSRELAECLQADSASKNVLRYSLSELADNAVQHSNTRDGALVTAQRYQRIGRVRMLIVDTGIGIRQHLSRHPKFKHIDDDGEAIETALKPFVTGTFFKKGDTPEFDNQGLGLAVVNEIAKRSSGFLWIWSGSVIWKTCQIQRLPVSWGRMTKNFGTEETGDFE